jgi:hypothetical protein
MNAEVDAIFILASAVCLFTSAFLLLHSDFPQPIASCQAVALSCCNPVSSG